MVQLRWLLASFMTELGKQLPILGKGKNPSTTWTLTSFHNSNLFKELKLSKLMVTTLRKDSILALNF